MSRGKKGLFSGLALLGLVLLLVGSAGAQTATSDVIGGADNLAPGPVAEVMATADEADLSVEITWTPSMDDYLRQTAAGADFTSGGVFANVSDVAAYKIYQSVEGGDPELLGEVASGATSFSAGPIEMDMVYVFSIVALDAAGLESGMKESDPVLVETPAAPVAPIKVTIAISQARAQEILQDPVKEAKFREDIRVVIARRLGVPVERIIIKFLRVGSLIVEFEIIGGEEGTPTPEELATTFKTQVKENPATFITELEDGTELEAGDIAEGGLSSIEQVTGAPVDLGDILPDATASEEITVTNEGTEEQTVTTTISGDGFAVSESELVLQAGGEAVIEVSFDAATVDNMEGAYAGRLVIATDVPELETIHELTATVLPPPPVIDLSGVEFKFAQVQIDDSATKTLTISNKGVADLTATLAVSGDDVFTVDPASVTVVAGEEAEVTITFAPVAEAEYSSTITITSNDPANPEKTVAMSGVGVVEVALLLPGDFDSSGDVGFDDFFLFADQFGTTTDSPNWSPIFDMDASGDVGFDDFFLFADNFGKSLPAE